MYGASLVETHRKSWRKWKNEFFSDMTSFVKSWIGLFLHVIVSGSYLLQCFCYHWPNNNNYDTTIYIDAVTCPWSHYKGTVHPVHAMTAEQRQTATDPWTKPTDLSHWPACRQLRNYVHHRHHYYSAQKPILNVRNNFLAKYWSQLYTLHIYIRHVLLPEMFCWFCCIIIRLTGKRVALKEIRLQPEEGTPFTAIREGWWLNTKLLTYVSVFHITVCDWPILAANAATHTVQSCPVGVWLFEVYDQDTLMMSLCRFTPLELVLDYNL